MNVSSISGNNSAKFVFASLCSGSHSLRKEFALLVADSFLH